MNLPDKLDLQILEEACLEVSKNIDNDSKDVFSYMEDLPYYHADTLIDMGVYSSVRDNNYFDTLPDNFVIGEDKDIRQWYEAYKLACNGIIVQEYSELASMRIKKLYDLYSDYDAIKESGDIDKINARKQSILELGYNPELPFDIETRHKITKLRREEFLRECCDYTEEDISNWDCEDISLTEATNTKDIQPVYVIITYTGTAFGKLISKMTDSIYSHAGISFTPNLDEIFSFNAKTKGFSKESIQSYIQGNKDSIMALYTILVPKFSLDKMKSSIEDIENNHYHYSFLTGLGAVFNKPIKANHGMICSQFVDVVLKTGNIKVMEKDSSKVLPKDFHQSKSKLLVKIFEGPMQKYTPNIASSRIGKYITNLSEATCILEVKEFPVEFNSDGDLLIKNMKKMDYESEYSKSHKLLKNYETVNNIEGMKYEVSKLWFINSILETKIYNKKPESEERNRLWKIRIKVLNDFHKYIKLLLNEEKNFNFTEYYDKTPFSNATYKIKGSTLKYTIKAVKAIL